MKTADIQAYINCRDNRGVIVDQHDQEVYVSVFVSGGHAACFMSQGETLELITTLQTILANMEIAK
jgi:hypothetical protein